jgi:hypothetical protein
MLLGLFVVAIGFLLPSRFQQRTALRKEVSRRRVWAFAGGLVGLSVVGGVAVVLAVPDSWGNMVSFSAYVAALVFYGIAYFQGSRRHSSTN